MGLFKIFKKKETEKKTFVVGQVGDNPNKKLVEKDRKLFMQEKELFGNKETPIKPVQEEKKETK